MAPVKIATGENPTEAKRRKENGLIWSFGVFIFFFFFSSLSLSFGPALLLLLLSIMAIDEPLGEGRRFTALAQRPTKCCLPRLLDSVAAERAHVWPASRQQAIHVNSVLSSSE